MGYSNLVKRQVKFAFNSIGDLATTVTLVRNNVTSFNFKTKQIVAAAPIRTSVLAVITKSKKQSKSRDTLNKSLMLQKEDLGDVTQYDQVEISGVVWSVGKPIEDDGYLIYLEIYKEL